MEKIVTDQDSIFKIINSLFGVLPVTITYSDREFPIKVVALRPQGLVIRNTLKIEAPNRKLNILHNGNQISCDFVCLARDNNGLEVLKPEKVTIRTAIRQSNRLEVPSDSQGSEIVITNIINQSEIFKALGFNDKKVETIIQNYLVKIKHVFPYCSIFISDKPDNRLRAMTNYDRPIYILDRNEQIIGEGDYVPLQEYNQILKSIKLNEKFISEVCIPFKFKKYVTIGYVQVLSEFKLEMGMYQSIQKIADSLCKDIVASGLFQESKEVCNVGDISMSGISFFHPQTRLMTRSFIPGAVIIFDLSHKSSFIGSFRTIIKNIKPTETSFRFGCQFHPLSQDELKSLEVLVKTEDGDPDPQTNPND